MLHLWRAAKTTHTGQLCLSWMPNPCLNCGNTILTTVQDALCGFLARCDYGCDQRCVIDNYEVQVDRRFYPGPDPNSMLVDYNITSLCTPRAPNYFPHQDNRLLLSDRSDYYPMPMFSDRSYTASYGNTDADGPNTSRSSGNEHQNNGGIWFRVNWFPLGWTEIVFGQFCPPSPVSGPPPFIVRFQVCRKVYEYPYYVDTG